METNSMLPGMGSGTLGLEMPLHQQPPPSHHLHHPHHMTPFTPCLAHDSNSDHHSHQQQQQPPPPPPKHAPPYGMQVAARPNSATGGKVHLSSFSDDEETASGYAPDDGGAADGLGGKKGSLWHRMKWTDEMVRLLIMVVYFVGDDGAGLETGPGGEKKKPTAVASGGSSGLLQKKGKWKSVSRAMMEKGFYVSPQQCEDKFNDLNKRYKRVNDIIGKGTACKVVENHSLLDTMDNISPKMKDEVRKLLNSKHLFFREMCAYHTSCAGGHQPCDAATASHQLPPPPPPPPPPQLVQPLDQRYFHPELGNREAEDENNEEDEDGSDDDDDEEGEDIGYGDDLGEKAAMDDKSRSSAKRIRRSGSVSSLSPMQQQLKSEMASVFQDGGKSVWEQRQWIRSRSTILEEQKVSYQGQALELERQRFKWQKFSMKKERELERMKLDNERMRLENERMLLILRQKECEIDSVIRRSEPSSITG